MPRTANPDPSDSKVQKEVESAMLDRLSKARTEWTRVDWQEAATNLKLAWVWKGAAPDAAWRIGTDKYIVGECYARIGSLAEGHKRKLAKDALKLWAVRTSLADASRLKCVLILPSELEDRLHGIGWLPVALRMAAEIISVELTPVERERLTEACRLQGGGQARMKRRISRDE